MLQDSIFGKLAPKFVRSTTTVLLDYWITTRDEPESMFITHESDINKHREYDFFTGTKTQDHWLFEGIINLAKYSDPASKFNEIFAHKRELVQLWRRRDGDFFENSSSATVYFLLKEIIPFNFDKPGFPDRLLLKFESQDFVDISKQVTSGIYPQLEEIIMSNDY